MAGRVMRGSTSSLLYGSLMHSHPASHWPRHSGPRPHKKCEGLSAQNTGHLPLRLDGGKSTRRLPPALHSTAAPVAPAPEVVAHPVLQNPPACASQQQGMYTLLRQAALALRECQSAATQTATRPEGCALQLWLGSLQLMQQQYYVGDRTVSLVAPVDVDEVIDWYLERGLTDSDPYWTRVWPSAIALATLILQRPELVRGKKVADLGAGLGLAGMAAALAGAREVVLLDREPLALQCALMSAAATGIAAVQPGMPVAAMHADCELSTCVPCGDDSSAHQQQPASIYFAPHEGSTTSLSQRGELQASAQRLLEWVFRLTACASNTMQLQSASEPARLSTASMQQSHQSTNTAGSDQPRLQTCAPAYRAEVWDWHSADGHEKFDVVLACDVLYEQEAVEPISRVLPKLLRSQGGVLLLADPPNRTAKNREAFVAKMEQQMPRFVVSECSVHECEVSKLDNEMVGGVKSETLPVQLMVLRTVLGKDTVGLKYA